MARQCPHVRILELVQRVKELEAREQVNLTGHQIKDILELSCPDGDNDQLSEHITIFYRPKDEVSTDTNEPLPKGYYFYWDECPEEGVVGPIGRQRGKAMSVESNLLSELRDLMKKYQVEFYYTNDDDGVHVASFGNDVFVGSLHADHPDEIKEAIKRWKAVPNKAPFTHFGKTKMLPIKVYIDGKYVDDKPQWDLEMWVERSEEWYAFSGKSLRGKRVRVVTREDWLRCKVTEVTSGR